MFPKPRHIARGDFPTGTTRSPPLLDCEMITVMTYRNTSNLTRYLISVASHKLFMVAKCSTLTLRYTNLLATLFVAMVAARCRSFIQDGREKRSPVHSFHTGLNVALFPVIIFFSGLYYTDVISTLVVLVAYENHLYRVGAGAPNLVNDVWTLVLGVAALFMRQTNIFWVVVYMGGLEAAHAIRRLKPPPVDVPKQMSLLEHIKFYLWRDSVGDSHDPPLDAAWPEGMCPGIFVGLTNFVDWLFCLLSIGVAAVCNPAKVLRQVWPHVTVLGLFVAFVAWNGGVVLGMSLPSTPPYPQLTDAGDKSNHIATIHLAQMLYIWPFFAFFSAPLLLPSIFINLQRATTLAGQMWRKVYYLPYIAATVALSLAIVKYNTIIHPFTLADNRHYMFYVFRYTILRSMKLRYALVAGYTLFRWLVWDTLAGPNPQPASVETKQKPTQTSQATPPISPPTSTALFWLLATTLSLITAPLVEPRYFILPWIFWRLLVPTWSPPFRIPGLGWLQKTGADPRLLLETLWFLAINVGTMYMFLARPFYWRGADGELLDGGKVQRFMW